ncbi:MAG: hypothetical protein SGARI_002025 [Bacillariaceae sp.]
MFNSAFTTRRFLWEPETDKAEIQELLDDIKLGIITHLDLDYSNGLWNEETKGQLRDAMQDPRCSLVNLSLRSCQCGDDFINMCVNEEYEASLPPDLPQMFSVLRLGSRIHQGTAGMPGYELV